MSIPEKRLLDTLIRFFGRDRVLTAVEHLYVYSHSGKFGVESKLLPLAVLKLNSDIEITHLEELLKDTDIQVIRNNEGSKEPDIQRPYILLDVQKPITITELERNISQLNEEKLTQKDYLKQAKSFQHWMVSFLQNKDGFQLSRTKNDSGFCVVQSYFNDIQSYSAKGRLILSKGLLKDKLAPSKVLIDSLFSCTSCGQCYDQLSLGVLEINKAIIKARQCIAEQDCVPKKFDVARDNINEKGNPMGLEAEDRVLWIEEEVEKYPYEHNPVLYWPGCVTSYRLPELITSSCYILEKAGYDFGVLGEHEGCCGLILYLSGRWDEAAINARKIVEQLKNVKRLVTNCAGCYYAFSQVFAQLEVQVPFEVLHMSQIIKASIKNEKLGLKELKGNYTWHDPCDLGRHCNVYEPPRFVLKSIPGLNLVEPSLTQEHTVCCGAGGGLWMYNEEATNYVSHQKILEDIPSNIDGIITGCPTCILSLRRTASEVTPDLKIWDIVEIVNKCLK